MRYSILIILLILINSCIPEKDYDINEVRKQEILKVEQDFVNMVAKDGISKAFLHFAADDAVLLRNDQLYLGKGAIKNMYSSLEKSNNISLTWHPDFVDVSSSGDLAYTYGEYLYTVTDQEGNVQQEKGIFHTVWKKQDDGEWRFVWD